MITADLESGDSDSGVLAATAVTAATTTAPVDEMQSAEIFDASRGAASEASSQLTTMKLAELKALYKEGGGRPGTLRKAELVARLTRSMKEQGGSGAAADARSDLSARVAVAAVPMQGFGSEGASEGVARTAEVGQGEGHGAASSMVLSKMKVSELKAMYKEGGGSPGTLRKAELVAQLTRSFEAQGVDDCGPRSEYAIEETDTAASIATPQVASAGDTAVDALVQVKGTTPGMTSLPRDVIAGTTGAASPLQSRDTPSDNDSAESHASIHDKSRAKGRNVGEEVGPETVRGGSPIGHRDVDVEALDCVLGMESLENSKESARAIPAAATEISSGFVAPPELALANAGLTASAASIGDQESVAREYGEDTATEVAKDMLSSGPSAVVAAARARGAAAAAASARVAAGGRARAVAEARKHTEAVQSRAAGGWARSAEFAQDHQYGHLDDPHHPDRYDETRDRARRDSHGQEALQRRKMSRGDIVPPTTENGLLLDGVPFSGARQSNRAGTRSQEGSPGAAAVAAAATKAAAITATVTREAQHQPAATVARHPAQDGARRVPMQPSRMIRSVGAGRALASSDSNGVGDGVHGGGGRGTAGKGGGGSPDRYQANQRQERGDQRDYHHHHHHQREQPGRGAGGRGRGGPGKGGDSSTIRSASGGGGGVSRSGAVSTAGVSSAGSPRRTSSGRPRLLPKMANPWARAGAGGAAEGLAEEGDEVEEYLSEKMMEASDKDRSSSGDELFAR